MTFQFGTNSSANETLHKTVSLGSDISCIVKDPIDILSPYLIVKDTEVNLTDNYAKCTDTNRYYFIIVEDFSMASSTTSHGSITLIVCSPSEPPTDSEIRLPSV